MQKTRERRSSFTPLVICSASGARWNAFAAECAGWLVTRAENGVRARAATGEGRLLAIFDVLESWLDGRDSEAASVVEALMRLNDRHPVGRVVSQQTQRMRALVVELGHQAGLVDVEGFAESWHLLLRGTAVRVVEGDVAAPARAREMGRDVIARHRPLPVVVPRSFAPDGELSSEIGSEFDWVDSPRAAAIAIVAIADSVRDADARTIEEFDAYGWDPYWDARPPRTA